MAVATAPALFDVLPGGGFVMPGPEVVDLQGSAYNARQWQQGAEQLLGQGDRAVYEVAPDSIGVVTHAGHLTLALDALSQSNQANGFTKAAASVLHRERVEKFAGRGTDRVAAQKAADALAGRELARYHFFAANGLGDLAVAGSAELTPQQRIARRVMGKRWEVFQEIYGAAGPAARKERHAYMKQLSVYTSREETES